MAMATAFNAAVGSTIVTNSAEKVVPPGNPTIRSAAVKNTDPEMTVPTAASTAAPATVWLYFFTAKIRAKTTKAVMILSIIFGSCPPGNVVVMAEINPVATPTRPAALTFGNSKIANTKHEKA